MRVAFFTYNLLDTGGAELSFGNLMRYLQENTDYVVKHIRDYRDIYHFKPQLLICLSVSSLELERLPPQNDGQIPDRLG